MFKSVGTKYVQYDFFFQILILFCRDSCEIFVSTKLIMPLVYPLVIAELQIVCMVK